ncbi:MAG: protein-tyrosine phosphatase family protein [Anaerolineales bacterium]
MSSHQASPPRPVPESYWVIPAQFLAGEYPGTPYFAELTRQRLDLFLAAGFDTFMDLTTPGEIEPYEPLLREQAAYYNLSVQYTRFPIRDFSLPQPAQMTTTLNAIQSALTAGRKLYLHCHGGIGRTGTVVGCYLVRQGLTGQQALGQLAAWWQHVPKSSRYPHSPETFQQEQFVREWHIYEQRAKP